MKKKPKKPSTKKKRRITQKDENKMAFDVVAQITESDAAKALGRKGGLARRANKTDEELSEIGRQGALARWGKRREETAIQPTAIAIDSDSPPKRGDSLY
jgi:hypothetical protein